MFAQYVFEKCSAAYSQRVLILDTDRIEERLHYSRRFEEGGFTVIHYTDDLHLRAEYDELLNNASAKYVIIAAPNIYVPYDVRIKMRVFEVSFAKLFPRLHSLTLKDNGGLDLDLLAMAYQNSYDTFRDHESTLQFIEHCVYSRQNVQRYLEQMTTALRDMAEKATTYCDWFSIISHKAQIDVMAAEFSIRIDTEVIQPRFEEYILQDYGKLSSVVDSTSPVLVSRAMEFMKDHSEKFAVIVMDGMSQFDWQIIQESFRSFHYTKSDVFAMIPTTTSVSRQCLLGGKFPSQLIDPWTQTNEKKEFMNCAVSLGYQDTQIAYGRGYEALPPSSSKCAAIIINDVDDLVHGQQQGRLGMFNDITVLMRSKKLADLVRQLIKTGFDVYITADHGNTPCVGMGKLVGTGVDVETKSRRMLVLKDYADKQGILSKYNMIDYPKYYLKKGNDYLLCEAGTSFDAKGDDVMSHGGITLDEVIVPFISIKAGDNNG